ncbi:MAG: hypothetical protein JEZ01_19860 [Labilibaculum sp.]|nr:hypothetical protein [Labilibaculum sp.]MBI9060032.1 hypothetical protein [Labilibaculum sp.]
MKYLLYTLILVSIISCSNNPQAKKLDKIEVTEQSSTVLQNPKNAELKTDSIIETATETEENSECIFDQTTQTDDFLKGKMELDNYIWDSISKTATIILENKDTLLITRGGCDHFEVSAEFRLRNDKTDYKDWNNVNKRVLWISRILESEFSYYEIKNEIDSVTIITQDDNAYFSNEYLQDNNYVISRRIDEDLTVISLSYYLN